MKKLVLLYDIHSVSLSLLFSLPLYGSLCSQFLSQNVLLEVLIFLAISPLFSINFCVHISLSLLYIGPLCINLSWFTAVCNIHQSVT